MPLVCIAKTCIVTCLPACPLRILQELALCCVYCKDLHCNVPAPACSMHGMLFMYAIMRLLYARYSTVVISHSCLDLAICGHWADGPSWRYNCRRCLRTHASQRALGAERSSSVSISALDHRRSSHRRSAFRCWPTGSRWSASDSRASAGEGTPIRLFCVSRLISVCFRLAPR